MTKQLEITFDFEPVPEFSECQSFHSGLNYEIGANYVYPNDTKKKVFRLKSVTGFVFHFEGGHCCTDTIFKGLKKLN